jgi:hypothetical protein
MHAAEPDLPKIDALSTGISNQLLNHGPNFGCCVANSRHAVRRLIHDTLDSPYRRGCIFVSERDAAN